MAWGFTLAESLTLRSRTGSEVASSDWTRGRATEGQDHVSIFHYNVLHRFHGKTLRTSPVGSWNNLTLNASLMEVVHVDPPPLWYQRLVWRLVLPGISPLGAMGFT